MSDSIHDQVPWNRGAERPWGWDLLITYLVLGTLLNASQLLVHFLVKELRRQPVALLIIWLAAEDFLFDLLCLIQCSLNRTTDYFYGTETLCVAQAVWAEFLMSLSGLTLVLLMYTSWSAIVRSQIPTATRIHQLQLGAVSYCFILSLLTNVWPGHGKLNSSGVYCFSNAGVAVDGTLFHVFYALPVLGLLVYFYVGIWRAVVRLTAKLEEHGFRGVRAKPAQVRMAKLMSVYIVALLLVLVPFEATFWFSWVTGRQAPANMWIVAAVGGHLLTFVSPILYYVLNARARQVLWSCGKLNRVRATEGDLSRLLRLVLRDEVDTEALLAFYKTKACPEAVLFWRDVVVWKRTIWQLQKPPSPHGLEATRSSSPSPSCAELIELMPLEIGEEDVTPLASARVSVVALSSAPPSPPSRYRQLNDTLTIRELAVHIFEVYLDTPNAPEELNISAEQRRELTQQLGIERDEKNRRWISTLAWREDLDTLFDGVEQEIITLLVTNHFQEFMEQPAMHDKYSAQAGAEDHISSHSSVVLSDRERKEWMVAVATAPEA